MLWLELAEKSLTNEIYVQYKLCDIIVIYLFIGLGVYYNNMTVNIHKKYYYRLIMFVKR